jgi:DNA-binding transcriptional LysR family regulator
VEVHQVKYFLALCETLNFTRAAEKCNVAQPSLTRAIQNLEGELGGPLFHRERQNTHLTELGRMMVPYLQQLLRQIEAAKQRARGLSLLDQVELNLGMMCTIGPGRLMALMETYRQGHPGVSLTLRDANGETLRRLLRAGELDLAVLALPEIDEELHSVPLFHERFLIAYAPGHRFAEGNGLSIGDLHGETYLRRSNCEFGEQFHRLLEERGVQPNCIYRSEREDWVQVMVRAGLGFAIVPEYSLTIEGLGTRPLADLPLSRTVSIVTVRGRPHSPAVGAFVRDATRQKWPG